MTESMDDFMVRISEDYLAGSYNENGIIAWWQRVRTELHNMSPMEAVSEGHYEMVEDLASELLFIDPAYLKRLEQ